MRTEGITEAVVVRERSSVLLAPVMDITTAKERLKQFQEFCAHYLQESEDGGNDGGDYGIIPGTSRKKILLKSGADKLCEVYGLYDEYVVMSCVEDWDKGLFDYTLKCVLKSRRDDSMVGAGVGSCSSFESKYRWRDMRRKCPKCGVEAIIKGKEEYGGGWVCFDKKGGCRAKFKDGDKSIEGQIIGRIENEDIADVKNTVLKMAKKRAKIDAVIGVTRSSGLFTQDLDEIPLPPPKPEPQVTTEDIEIGAVSPTVAPPQEGPTAAGPNVPDLRDLQAEAKRMLSLKQGTVPDGCITEGQQVNFHRSFKAALREDIQKDARDKAHQWLKRQGIVDSNGEGTAKAIRKENYIAVRDEAVRFAKSL